VLKDPATTLFHNEAIVRNGMIVDQITSGNYGHALGGAVGLGYVPCLGQSDSDLLGSHYEIEIAGKRFEAIASLAPMYDPKSTRTRA
jgi:glycine cleavage system aminomethyltransferase T